ncbi:peptide deformylase [bacterium]|nr:peptide deformylase [bacterium]MBU1754581.1 peptide deformylase [bacterium]
MSILPIKLYGSPILRKKAKTLTEISEKDKDLIADMIDTMYTNCGVGLAAPQIGVSKRIIVVDVSTTENSTETMVIINPEIIKTRGEKMHEEGCLSIPGTKGGIKRSEKIKASGINIDGIEFEVEVDGLVSRVIQHEIDHLDGILFVDKLSEQERTGMKNKLKHISSLARDNVDYYATAKKEDK